MKQPINHTAPAKPVSVTRPPRQSNYGAPSRSGAGETRLNPNGTPKK